MTTMPWSSVFVTFFMAIFTKIFPCEWKAPVAQGLCRRVGVSVIPFLGDNLQRNKKLFSTWPAVLMALAAFLPRKRCHCFNSRIFFFFLISGLIGGWRYGITLLTCGSLCLTLHRQQNWSQGRKCDSPGDAQVIKQGEHSGFYALSSPVQSATLPSQLCGCSKPGPSCHGFHGLAKGHCDRHGATCFWPALPSKAEDPSPPEPHLQAVPLLLLKTLSYSIVSSHWTHCGSCKIKLASTSSSMADYTSFKPCWDQRTEVLENGTEQWYTWFWNEFLVGPGVYFC